jgi:hypothetical protein
MSVEMTLITGPLPKLLLLNKTIVWIFLRMLVQLETAS